MHDHWLERLTPSDGSGWEAAAIEDLPKMSAVYVIIDKANSRILYVGKAVNLKTRFTGHHIPARAGWASSWEYRREDLIVAFRPIGEEIARRRFEMRMIRKLNPKYNIVRKSKRQYR